MVTVGIDPHKHVHVAVAVDGSGTRIGKQVKVKNDAHQLTAPLTWIQAITDGAPVTWTIEDGRGCARRLADALLLAGHEVVWWVPARVRLLTGGCMRLRAPSPTRSMPPRLRSPRSPRRAAPAQDR